MQKCITSWKKYCPDYEIIEWNEDNFDVNFCPYAAKAHHEKRWGFLSDVARLQIIYQNGGTYLDTDVELLRPIDDLLDNKAWFAYGTSTEINTGSGFGAVKGNLFVKELLDQYLSFPVINLLSYAQQLTQGYFIVHSLILQQTMMYVRSLAAY